MYSLYGCQHPEGSAHRIENPECVPWGAVANPFPGTCGHTAALVRRPATYGSRHRRHRPNRSRCDQKTSGDASGPHPHLELIAPGSLNAAARAPRTLEPSMPCRVPVYNASGPVPPQAASGVRKTARNVPNRTLVAGNGSRPARGQPVRRDGHRRIDVRAPAEDGLATMCLIPPASDVPAPGARVTATSASSRRSVDRSRIPGNGAAGADGVAHARISTPGVQPGTQTPAPLALADAVCLAVSGHGLCDTLHKTDRMWMAARTTMAS